MSRVVLTAERVVTSRGIREGLHVEVTDGVITSIGRDLPSTHTIDGTLLPGMIDLHIHGCLGWSVLDGPDVLCKISTLLAQRGITSWLPTAVSLPVPQLRKFLESVSEARGVQSQSADEVAGATILGANLEGPAIASGRRGAHDLGALTTPRRLLNDMAANPTLYEAVRMLTVAPEIDGGFELIRFAAERGWVASLGHTAADWVTSIAAIDAGARSVTHLFNQMPPLHHRSPGLVGAALTDHRVFVELIADGVHVDPVVWSLVFSAAAGRIVAVSDAMVAAGMPDGRAELGPLQVEVVDGVARLENGVLAGSTTLLDGALRNLRQAGLGWEAIAGATSTSPADLIGCSDKGRIAPGANADLIAVDDTGRVLWTMVAGRWIED